MALRIKSRWHDDDQERSLDEIAGALGFIIWRIAKDKAINLHGQDYVYETDEQRFAVITEYLIFQLQIVDRLALLQLELSDEERRKLVMTLARHLAGHLHEIGFARNVEAIHRVSDARVKCAGQLVEPRPVANLVKEARSLALCVF